MNLGGYQIVDCSNINMEDINDRKVFYDRIVKALDSDKPIMFRNLYGHKSFFSNVKRFVYDKYGDGDITDVVSFSYLNFDGNVEPAILMDIIHPNGYRERYGFQKSAI